MDEEITSLRGRIVGLVAEDEDLLLPLAGVVLVGFVVALEDGAGVTYCFGVVFSVDFPEGVDSTTGFS